METTIYLPTAEGLNIVRGSGARWHGHSVLPGMQIQCLAVDAHSPGRVYCGTFGNGVLTSDDGGATWHGSRDLQMAKVTALCQSLDGTLYAGTEPSEVFRSSDNGQTWQPLSSLLSLPSSPTWSFPPRPETNHIQAILADRDQLGKLHVAVEAGALVSTDDDGRSWRDRVPGSPLDTHTIVTDPCNGKHLVSAAGDGCFESFDNGCTWKALVEGLDHAYCWSVAVHPSDPETLLLSASASAFTAHNPKVARSFVYRRSGSGPWTLAIEGLSAFPCVRIPVISAAEGEPGTFYLATEGTIFHSRNTGLAWEQLPVEWPANVRSLRHSLGMAVSQAEES